MLLRKISLALVALAILSTSHQAAGAPPTDLGGNGLNSAPSVVYYFYDDPTSTANSR
jgi:hypothetical protein